MRASVSRIKLCFLLLSAIIATAQTPPPRAPVDPKEAPAKLGPATSPTTEEAAKAVKVEEATPAMPTAAPVDPKTYTIGPEDILRIMVWREPELSAAVQVRPDGKITLNLIGEVQAAGQTPEQLKDKITEALTEYIHKPEVGVFLQSVQSRRFHLMGEVNRPGTFPLVVPVTVLEALTNAGGFREFANTKKIRILRKGKILMFNYNEVSKGKNLEQNIQIENGDYIIVPE
jgi:polysaccharide export outer membrane protein